MIDKIKRTLQEATDYIKEQANHIGSNAKEKSYQLIEEWLQVFPQLEQYGLEITSIALSVAISPALEVELKGEHTYFTIEKLNEINDTVKGNAALKSVFTTIRTTYNLHQRMNAKLYEPLVIKIRIRLSPEIKVYLGQPIIE